MCRDVIRSNTVHYIKTNKKADEFDSVDDDVMVRKGLKGNEWQMRHVHC